MDDGARSLNRDIDTGVEPLISSTALEGTSESGVPPRPAPTLLEGSPGHGKDDRQIRLLEGQSEVFKLVSRGASLDRSLTRLAAVVQQISVPALCSISVLNPSRTHFISVMGDGLPTTYMEAVVGLEVVPGASPCATAAFRREPVVVADITSDPRFARFHEPALAADVRSCWAFPILDRDGDSLGTIALLFHDAAREAQEDELRAIDSLCPLARLAIEHSRRADALENADNRFASLAASIPGVVYQRVVEPNGDIHYTYISDGARELFGVSPEEIVADPQALFDCHGPEYSATFRDRLIAASRALSMWDVEAPIITRGGQHKWTHAIARPHRRPDGAVVWDGIILDATRIKQVNVELAASNRAKSEFLANMSHELRTPLNAIIGFTEVIGNELFGKLENKQYSEYIRDIHSSGTHLLQIINDILDLSKIESGNLELHEQIVDLRLAIGNCLQIVRERAQSNKVVLVEDLEQDLPHIWADGRKIKQILINLLSNSIKFSRDGGHVVVSARGQDDGGLAFSVSDQGIGLEQEDIPKVFEPFIQADTGLRRNFEGTGLGLPLTKAMVELHGGTIEMQSERGVGTTVTVFLPPRRVVDEGMSDDQELPRDLAGNS